MRPTLKLLRALLALSNLLSMQGFAQGQETTTKRPESLTEILSKHGNDLTGAQWRSGLMDLHALLSDAPAFAVDRAAAKKAVEAYDKKS